MAVYGGNAGTKKGPNWATKGSGFGVCSFVPKTGTRVHSDVPPLTLQSLLFFGKSKGFCPKKARVFLFEEPLKSLEKRGKTHKKARKIGKRKKQGNRKKQGLEGQGLYQKPERGYMQMFSGARNENEGTFAQAALLRNHPFVSSRFIIRAFP